MLGASSALVRSISKGHVLPAVWRACYAGYATGSGGKVIELQTDSEYQAALKELSASQRAAILDFTATWCGPCKMIAPVLDSLAAEFPSISFYKIDIDKEAVRQAVTENSVAAVPTFVAYHGAERITAFSGADKAMLRQLAVELSGAQGTAPVQ